MCSVANPNVFYLFAWFNQTHTEPIGLFGVMFHQLIQCLKGSCPWHEVVTVVLFSQLVMLHPPIVQHWKTSQQSAIYSVKNCVSMVSSSSSMPSLRHFKCIHFHSYKIKCIFVLFLWLLVFIIRVMIEICLYWDYKLWFKAALIDFLGILVRRKVNKTRLAPPCFTRFTS